MGHYPPLYPVLKIHLPFVLCFLCLSPSPPPLLLLQRGRFRQSNKNTEIIPPPSKKCNFPQKKTMPKNIEHCMAYNFTKSFLEHLLQISIDIDACGKNSFSSSHPPFLFFPSPFPPSVVPIINPSGGVIILLPLYSRFE